jgi:hypothetical protein
MVMEINRNREIKAVNPEKGTFSINAKSIALAMGYRERLRGNILITTVRIENSQYACSPYAQASPYPKD